MSKKKEINRGEILYLVRHAKSQLYQAVTDCDEDKYASAVYTLGHLDCVLSSIEEEVE